MMNRLTILQINIIGIVAALVLALILWVGLIKPKQDAIASTNSQIASAESAGGTQDKVAEGNRQVQQKKQEVARTDAAWRVYSVKYMPGLPYHTGDTDPLTVYEFNQVGRGANGFKDIPTFWGRWITAWYDVQRKQGVSLLPGEMFQIPPEPTDPNAISQVNHLTFPADNQAWPVQLQCKNFDAAMRHLRSFNSMERHGMPVINNVRLDGQSPNLLLSYNLALYVIPSSNPPPADARLSGTAPQNGGNAMGGFGGPGMMGGMPGMPPMMGGRPGMMGGPMPGGSMGGPPAGLSGGSGGGSAAGAKSAD